MTNAYYASRSISLMFWNIC